MAPQRLILQLCLWAPLRFIWGIFCIPQELQPVRVPSPPGSSPVSVGRTRKGRGVTNCPTPLSGSGLPHHHTLKMLRLFLQSCWYLWSPDTTRILQGSVGSRTSRLPFPAKTNWLYQLLNGVGMEGALPYSPGWIARHVYFCLCRAKGYSPLLTWVGEIVDAQAPHWPHFHWWSLEIFATVEPLKHLKRQESK